MTTRLSTWLCPTHGQAHPDHVTHLTCDSPSANLPRKADR